MEPRKPLRIPDEHLGQNFQRDVAVQLRVARPVDLPHPAHTNRCNDFVRPEAITRGKRHRSEYYIVEEEAMR